MLVFISSFIKSIVGLSGWLHLSNAVCVYRIRPKDLKHIKSKFCLEPLCEKWRAKCRNNTSSRTPYFLQAQRTTAASSKFEGQKLQIKVSEFKSHRRTNNNFLQWLQILECFRLMVHISGNKTSTVPHCSQHKRCLMFASPFTEPENDRKNVDILCHTYGKKQIISLWKVLYFMWEKTKLQAPHQINHTIRTLFLKGMSILHI